LQVGEGTFIVTSDNWVGINDLDPDAKLEVSVDGQTTPDLFMLSSNDNNDGDRFIVKNNGNVGIGTTEPAKDLHIQSSAPTLRLTDSDTGGDVEFYGGSGGIVIGADVNNEVPDDSIAFELSGSEKVRILNNGNVGIGTTSPGGHYM
jgi:hypothetical protein